MLLTIVWVVIGVVLWATLERRLWGAAKNSTATPRPTNIAVPEQGEVEIRSSGSVGTAWPDGERVGLTPQTVQVAPGRHQVKVTRPGCEAAERRLEVVAGQRQRMKPEPVGPTPTRAPTATAGPNSTPRPTPIPALLLEAGATWVEPGIGMRFRYIPAGTFEMGSPPDEADRVYYNEQQHQVRLSRGYWMGETEVTQGQWKALIGSNPSHFSSCSEDNPVEAVSWFDAVSYANALSSKGGFEPCYEISGESVSFVGLE
ncbi:MAG: SUMF1/EgtB/PvdO family nonheme iron enzyme, partial [bacterium]|nr:SUMF1/EgtB/PvdO family nonheme iron enzyme [bacterium]